jgi:hypothetical protein
MGKLKKLAGYLRESGIREINLLDVGPGMAVKFIGRLSSIRHPLDLFRRLEVGLRAVLPLPVSAYESYEPVEILRIFANEGVTINISFADFDVTVLAVVWNQLGAKVKHLIWADLSVFPNETLTEHVRQFDVVLAQNIVSRIHSRQGRLNAARNLMLLSKPGGILSFSGEEMLQAGCLVAHPLAPAFCMSPVS